MDFYSLFDLLIQSAVFVRGFGHGRYEPAVRFVEWSGALLLGGFRPCQHLQEALWFSQQFCMHCGESD